MTSNSENTQPQVGAADEVSVVITGRRVTVAGHQVTIKDRESPQSAAIRHITETIASPTARSVLVHSTDNGHPVRFVVNPNGRIEHLDQNQTPASLTEQSPDLDRSTPASAAAPSPVSDHPVTNGHVQTDDDAGPG